MVRLVAEYTNSLRETTYNLPLWRMVRYKPFLRTNKHAVLVQFVTPPLSLESGFVLRKTIGVEQYEFYHQRKKH